MRSAGRDKIYLRYNQLKDEVRRGYIVRQCESIMSWTKKRLFYPQHSYEGEAVSLVLGVLGLFYNYMLILLNSYN